MLVDSHCHLDFPDFAAERDDVVARARDAGVGTMLSISTKLSTFDGVRAVAESYPDVYCTVGVHPHEADREEGAKDSALLVALARHPKVVGLGETGLDYYYAHSSRENQRAAFAAHLEAARETGLPVIVHSRDAESDTMEILREAAGKGGVTGLLHCFTGTRALADFALSIGFYVSFSGIITFKNAEDLRETAKSVPMDRLLVETDAPYLAPIPNRGKRNEPAFVVYTAALLARLKGVTPD
ncbi:MAG TPA: TatD family hydrolase, partial [Alphaproteobacteria bacterium]|nr:TatD family hydrolase [Alphaproteobacteria bacterium]